MNKQILNIGSLNIDYVYQVKEFPQPGETVSSGEFHKHVGGKGCNQSIAAARAGVSVTHLGKIGQEGIILLSYLQNCGVSTKFIQVIDGPTGHAIIQVNENAQNCIVLHGGANSQIEVSDIKKALEDFGRGDIALLQNETSSVKEAIELCKQRGMIVVLNPAPMNDMVKSYPLHLVDYLIVNETELRRISDENSIDSGIDKLSKKFPNSNLIVTLGENGAKLISQKERIHQPAERVKAIDTTAAGDTFVGYFIAAIAKGLSHGAAIEIGCKAAAICVTKRGAAESIPEMGINCIAR